MACIALDAMGGDHGVDVTIPAALQALDDNSELKLIFVGDAELLESKLKEYNAKPLERISVHHASQSVKMDESPMRAMRMRDSSMRIAISLVKEGEALACVSAGNTGALMAVSRYVLKMLPGIDRPAIISALPTIKGHTHMLDLGANVELSAQHLLEFAIMGSELTSAVDNIKEPTVGLLNIGQEGMKGNEQVKEADVLLANSHLNYVGFVEGTDIYKGTVDVVVCDGFIGNIALKASEGVAQMITHFAREGFKRNIFTKLAALAAMPVLRNIRKNIDPSNYNGASLLGLRGIVIKSHGGANIAAFKNAIQEAVIEVDKNIPKRIGSRLAEISEQENNKE